LDEKGATVGAMTGFGMRWAAATAGLAIAALAGCGPASNTAAPTPASSNALSPDATAVGAATNTLPPMPDPAADSRPDRVKFDDFAAHLERQQSDLAATDAAFLTAVRTATQSGGDAKQVLAGYRSQIAADIAALPGPPRLSGCFAKAAAPNAKAEAALAAMLSDRRDKAGAVAAITDRALTLPDFGGLATDIATRVGADDAKTGLADARTSVAACGSTPPPAHRQGAPGGASPTASSSTAAPATSQPPVSTTTAPTPQPAPASPKKKPNMFQRLFGAA
jgi:hypothetical protein